ncbi:MAG: AAA family ATPase [Kiritimatiellae bacterium]|nr:AAA family ATPase [Kiritimatiellia bacterium]MCO5045542.1 AAA family ATPase [Kiritimatiellia bacterium]MCO5061578.1 AAA family ATPase [Kiritimatiellia bacterium]MCO5067363.1 AAA family ATPase [Kiritimatiellia bacterium]
MSLRIEFCGVPASGKSTLCAAAVNALRARGRRVLDREDVVKMGLSARDFGLVGNAVGRLFPAWRRRVLGLPHGLNDWHAFAVERPAFVALLHEWLAVEGGDSVWRSAIFYALLTSAFELQFAEASRETALLDEGFAHRFFSLRGYRGLGRNEDAARYAAAMPLPAALIWVDTPPEVCVERVQKRAQMPVLFSGEPADILPQRFAEGSALLRSLADAVAARGVPVFRASGIERVESEAQRLAEFVETIWADAKRETQ